MLKRAHVSCFGYYSFVRASVVPARLFYGRTLKTFFAGTITYQLFVGLVLDILIVAGLVRPGVVRFRSGCDSKSRSIRVTLIFASLISWKKHSSEFA